MDLLTATLLISIITLLLIAFFNYLSTFKRYSNPGYKEVPFVKGALPFVGHGITFSKDIIGFIRKARQEYGDIFRIKIFKKNLIVVCDHNLKTEYFAATEDKMSLYDVLESLYFSDAFADDPQTLPQIIKVVKSSIKIKFDEFAPKIKDEAEKMVKRMRKMDLSTPVNLSQEMIKFVACTSARCFIGIELSSELYDALMHFTNMLNKIVVLTYFIPKSLLKFIVNPFLRYYRMKIINNYLIPEIQRYRDNPNLNESLVIRTAINYIDKETNHRLSNQEIGETIMCLLYVSSENTALGLAACIFDITKHDSYWERIAEECKICLSNDDINAVFSAPLLDACVTESCRMNTHVFALQRKPKSLNAVLGEYYVGNCDSVALCEPMLMLERAPMFKDASKYYPERFIGQNPEPKDAKSILTFGANHHLCPGRLFSLMEIKTAIALITNNFEQFKTNMHVERDYFSPSAFCELRANLLMKKKNKMMFNKDLNMIKINNLIIKSYKNGWLIRNSLSNEEQKDFYNYTININNNINDIINFSDESKPYPISYHNLVYTSESNCSEPIKWYEWSKNLWQILQNNNIEIPKVDQFNSMYSQLYHLKSTMTVHKDEYVDWGISVSLGASCEFIFGDQTILLHSGDVFIADFSKVDHGIKRILETMPGWFDDENIKTFGRHRMSIQIRNIKNYANFKLNMNEFIDMINN
jgi:cytochrome P450